jgi:hypothetical protein
MRAVGDSWFPFSFRAEHDWNHGPQVQMEVKAAVSGYIGSKAVL